MEFDKLKCFLAVVKYKHFTLAAEEMCISQSSLSKQIKALEYELGTKLFCRNTRNISLTPFGEEFVEFSSRVIQEYNQMNIKLREHIGLEKQSLKIGAVPVMNQHGITSMIASFEKSFSNIHIEIVQRKTKELINLLEAGEIDIAFFVTDSKTDLNFHTYPVMYDELALIVDVKHPLANRDIITFSEIAGESFIFFDSASGMHDITMDLCKQAGFTPKILHQCTQIDTILELVSEGIGVSLLMDKVVSYFNNPRIKIIHFEKSVIGTTVLAIPKNKKLSRSVEAFRRFTVELKGNREHL